MPARRLLMRKIREVLRLKHERGLSQRAIAQACAIGVGTVTLYLKHLKRTAQQGLGWPLRGRRQPHLRGPGRPLRRGRPPCTAEETAGPGCRRKLCAHRAALDTRPAARPDLLRARALNAAILPSSTRIIAAAATTGFVIDARPKIASRRIGDRVSRSRRRRGLTVLSVGVIRSRAPP